MSEFVPHTDWPFPKQHVTAADLEINILREEIERLTKELFKAKSRYSREWRSLTSAELRHIYETTDEFGFEIARAVEAKLMEKNA